MSADFIPSEFADLDNNLGESQLPNTGNFTWDTSNKRLVQKGQALGSGGDRWRLEDNAAFAAVYVDANAVLVHDLTSVSTGITGHSFKMADGYPSFNFGSTLGTNPNTTINQVFGWGHNLKGGNQILDTSTYATRMAIEGGWENIAGHNQVEFHWSVLFPDGSEIRPVTAEVTTDTKVGLVKLYATTFLMDTEDASTGIFTVARLPDTTCTFTIYNGAPADGSGGFPYQFSEQPDYTTAVGIGRSASPDTTLTLGGLASRFLLPTGQIGIGQADVTVSSSIAITTPNGWTALRVRQGAAPTQSSILVESSTFTPVFEVNQLGNLIIAATAGSAAIDLSGSAATYPIQFKNNAFTTWKDNTGTQKIVIGIGLDNTLSLFSASGGDIKLAPETGSAPATYVKASTGVLQTGAGLQVTSSSTVLNKLLSATATLDFPSTSAGTSSDLTVTVTGAAVGDSVSLGLPASPPANCCFTGWVSATNTVTVRLNNYSSGLIDPASGTYRVTVHHF